jgi:hypothetical protein
MLYFGRINRTIQRKPVPIAATNQREIVITSAKNMNSGVFQAMVTPNFGDEWRVKKAHK